MCGKCCFFRIEGETNVARGRLTATEQKWATGVHHVVCFEERSGLMYILLDLDACYQKLSTIS
jgi:hypothetical protein